MNDKVLKKYNDPIDDFDVVNKRYVDNLIGGDTVGSIKIWSGETAPTGYLLCDGSAVSRTEYEQLFGVIGTKYGAGDGSTTFNLPDLKGKVVVGLDSTQTEFDEIGKSGGEKTHLLDRFELPSHSHSLAYGPHADGSETGYPFAISYNSATNSTSGKGWNNNLGTFPTGGNRPHNILQPYMTLNYVIKAKASEVVKDLGIEVKDLINRYLKKSAITVFSRNQTMNGGLWSYVRFIISSNRAFGNGFSNVGTEVVANKDMDAVMVSAHMSLTTNSYSYYGDIEVIHKHNDTDTTYQSRNDNVTGGFNQTFGPMIIKNVKKGDTFRFAHYTDQANNSFTTIDDDSTFLTIQEL